MGTTPSGTNAMTTSVRLNALGATSTPNGSFIIAVAGYGVLTPIALEYGDAPLLLYARTR